MQATDVNIVRTTADRSSLMNIGRKVDYAVRALSYLAAQPHLWVVGSKEIARRQDIRPITCPRS